MAKRSNLAEVPTVEEQITQSASPPTPDMLEYGPYICARIQAEADFIVHQFENNPELSFTDIKEDLTKIAGLAQQGMFWVDRVPDILDRIQAESEQS